MLNAMVYSAVIISIDDADSSKGLLRLSSINKSNQIMVSRNLFSFHTLHYTSTFCYVHVSQMITICRCHLNFRILERWEVNVVKLESFTQVHTQVHGPVR